MGINHGQFLSYGTKRYLLLFRRRWWVLKYISTTGLENSRGEQQKSMRETEVRNGWLKRQPTEVMFYVAMYVALYMFLLSFDPYIMHHGSITRRFSTNFSTRDTMKRTPRQTWDIIFICQILYRMRIEAENFIPNFAIIPFQLFHETVWTFLDINTPFYLYLYKLLVEIRKTFAIARRH